MSASTKAVLSQALEALAYDPAVDGYMDPFAYEAMLDQACASLRAALAEGEAEPVGWQMIAKPSVFYPATHKPTDIDNFRPVFASPAALRAAVIEECADECERMMMYPGGRCEAPAHNNVWEAAAAIRKLKEPT